MSTANDLIGKLPEAFVPASAHGLNMTVQLMIDEPMYTVIENDMCRVHHGHAEAPDLVVTLADDDLVGILTGRLNAVKAFMTGRMRVRGDRINARKLPRVFDRNYFC